MTITTAPTTATAPKEFAVDAYQLVDYMRGDIAEAVTEAVKAYLYDKYEVEQIDAETFREYRWLITDIVFGLIENNLNSIAKTADLPTSSAVSA